MSGASDPSPSWQPPHPCDQHPSGRHTERCLAGGCGFCGTSLDQTPSGECHVCERIVCEDCDVGYDPDLGPICRPCRRQRRNRPPGLRLVHLHPPPHERPGRGVDPPT